MQHLNANTSRMYAHTYVEIRRLLRLCLLADARLIAGAWMPQVLHTPARMATFPLYISACPECYNQSTTTIGACHLRQFEGDRPHPAGPGARARGTGRAGAFPGGRSSSQTPLHVSVRVFSCLVRSLSLHLHAMLVIACACMHTISLIHTRHPATCPPWWSPWPASSTATPRPRSAAYSTSGPDGRSTSTGPPGASGCGAFGWVWTCLCDDSTLVMHVGVRELDSATA